MCYIILSHTTLHVALEVDDGPCLPHSLSGMNAYTKMTTVTKIVAVMVKKLTASLITIAKGIKVAQVVAANAVSQGGSCARNIGEARLDSRYPAN